MQAEQSSSEALPRALSETEHVTLNEAEYVLALFTEGAKAYWRMWGPLGAPMVHALQTGANMQYAYLQWLRQTSRAKSYAQLHKPY